MSYSEKHGDFEMRKDAGFDVYHYYYKDHIIPAIVYNTMLSCNYLTFEDLAGLTFQDLKNAPNFGRVSFARLNDVLKSLGLAELLWGEEPKVSPRVAINRLKKRMREDAEKLSELQALLDDHQD